MLAQITRYPERHMGRFLVLAGLILIIIGIIWQWAPGLLHWFGRLPGDIRIETERSRIYIPVVSMLLVSIVLTLLVNILKR